MALRAEDMELRRQGLGASDIAAAVGMSRHCTPYQLWREKLGLLDADEIQEANLQTDAGRALEPVILAEFERRTRLTLSRKQEKVYDPVHRWRWVTLDAMASDGAVVEAKKSEIIWEWGEADDAIPQEYICQAQHAMACTGAPRCYVPVLLPQWKFFVYPLTRDDEFIEMLTVHGREFMRRVWERDPPAPIRLSDISTRWPSHVEGKKLLASEELIADIAQLREIKAKLKEIAALIEPIDLRVRTMIADAEEVVAAGKTLATYRQASSSWVFDLEDFAIEQPGIYAEYLREEPGSRRLLLKDPTAVPKKRGRRK